MIVTTFKRRFLKTAIWRIIGASLTFVTVAFFANFFTEETFRIEGIYLSIFYVVLLSAFGTALAKVMFNKLVQMSSPVFAASVTYMMTIVAVLWGVLDGEKIGFVQAFGGIIVLLGVYIANKKVKT